ncbi:MAG: MBOAT family O-acyltransferase [Chloroflexota bacterium]
MALPQILVFSIFAWLAGWLVPARWRIWVLCAASLIAIYWLQPSTPIRNLDFWLPTASIFLVTFTWVVTRVPAGQNPRQAASGFAIILGVVLLVGITRYTAPFCCLTPSRPPALWQILLVLALAGALLAIPSRLLPRARIYPILSILLILALFITLKFVPLAARASAGLRAAAGQSTDFASSADLAWLGFSYLAFRLLHTLRDDQSGKLPPLSLHEFITYALFFPAQTAGPIDRVQHFATELRQSIALEKSQAFPEHWRIGSQRILLGVFKKFILADSLALLALSAQNASQVNSTGWAWVLLYAYTLRIYFDFSGYTDIALGISKLLGISLPENFERPYLKQNLTAFWNSWHITLAQWFRAYFFYPLTRALRTRSSPLPAWVIVLLGQVATMLLIGLWHGITWNFAIWGLWHGLGLFIHNRWADWTRPRLAARQVPPNWHRLLQGSGWLLTFNYVALGWVWFALPDPAASWSFLHRLIGF